MFNQTFYHGSVRKLVVAFGTLFNNIRVQHIDDAGNIITNNRVPISYESKQRYIAEQIKEPNRTVPRMGFTMSAINYDQSRKIGTTNKLQRDDPNDPENRKRMFHPMPYNVDFTLDIYTRGIDDGLQVIEQILPYFHPEFNVTINELPEMGIKRDIPIVLQGVDYQDEFEGQLSEWRINNWTLTFSAQAWIYPGITDQGIIKKIGVSFSKDGYQTAVFDFENDTLKGDAILEGIRITEVNPTCSDDQYTDQVTCEANGGIWRGVAFTEIGQHAHGLGGEVESDEWFPYGPNN